MRRKKKSLFRGIVDAGGYTADDFVIKLTTTGASQSVTFPFYDGGTYDGTGEINWGDGGGWKSISAYNDANATNIYATAQQYEIIIRGNVTDSIGGINTNNSASIRTYVDDIVQWGTMQFALMNFYGCENMTVTATDIPDFTGMITLIRLFRDCHTVATVPNINSWDVSGITAFTEVFQDARLFNSDIGNWDVSAGTTFTGMFWSALVFNQDIGGWTFKNSGTITMNRMFEQADAFNQDLSGWNMTYVTTTQRMFLGCAVYNNGGVSLNAWDTQNVSNFSYMFYACPSFNQSVNFNTSSATSIIFMFYNATVFNQNLNTSGSIWDVSGIADFGSFLQNALAFNGTFTGWVTTSATQMDSFFNGCDSFNQSVNHFDVSGVFNFSNMFAFTDTYNQHMNSWDVSAGTTFASFLYQATAFNQALPWTFKASGTIDMKWFFRQATAFDQDISAWNIEYVNNFNLFFYAGSNGLSTANYDALLIAWDALSVTSGLTPHFGTSTYTKTQVDSGTTDGTTANKLVDSTQNFLTTVSIGDIVHNTVGIQPHSYAKVTAVDSDTQLSLNADIMTSGDTYQIETSTAVKAKENLINSDSWAISDAGGV